MSTTAGASGILGLIVLVVVIAGGFSQLNDQHQAQVAADLAALSAATAMLGGDADPCAVAADIADRNGARVASCTLAETSVAVEVRTRGRSADAVAGE